VGVRSRSTPALERREETSPQAGLVEGELEVPRRPSATWTGPFIDSKNGERNGRRLGFPRRKRKGRCRDSFRFSTGVMRCAGTTVTLPRLGTIRTHEATEALARKLAEGRPRSSLPPSPGAPGAGSCPSPWRSSVRSRSVIGGQRGGWHRGGGHAPAGAPHEASFVGTPSVSMRCIRPRRGWPLGTRRWG
jgi:hypothetical protein